MVVLSTEKLNEIVKGCGYQTLGSGLSSTIAKQINEFISDVNEAAMILAQLIHESGGFRHREEEGKGVGQPYVPYYGRGYIQLTWDYNYRAASQDILGNDTLLKDPDMVSRTEDMSMRVSVWFWKKFVRPAGGPAQNKFGMTTKVINSKEEGPWNPAAKKRYEHYKKAAAVLGVTNLASDAWD